LLDYVLNLTFYYLPFVYERWMLGEVWGRQD
jgi:hypothetical protein